MGFPSLNPHCENSSSPIKFAHTICYMAAFPLLSVFVADLLYKQVTSQQTLGGLLIVSQGWIGKIAGQNDNLLHERKEREWCNFIKAVAQSSSKSLDIVDKQCSL